MAEIQMQSGIDAKSLLLGITQMPLGELENFVRELNALITRKKSQESDERERISVWKFILD